MEEKNLWNMDGTQIGLQLHAQMMVSIHYGWQIHSSSQRKDAAL
jgi:hypothetical protein